MAKRRRNPIGLKKCPQCKFYTMMIRNCGQCSMDLQKVKVTKKVTSDEYQKLMKKQAAEYTAAKSPRAKKLLKRSRRRDYRDMRRGKKMK